MINQSAFCTGGEVGLRISASGTYPPELDTLPPVFYGDNKVLYLDTNTSTVMT